MMNSRKLVWSNLRVIVSLMALGIAAFSGNTVQAGTQYNYNCDLCHRMPPLDSASGKREAGTGAVKGNHQSHAGTTAATCVKCHGPALTAAGHRDKLIQVQGNINASPRGASYSRGFFNQTSVPPAPLGSCSNVNCHFEQTSPTWGSAAYSSPAGCVNCHGEPPAGGVTGSAGSHARHDSYFSGPAQCVKCHPNRLADASPFAHATSAATARVKVTLSDPSGAASGSYSGTGANFLPSQSAAQVFGACSNNYCHSTGNPAIAPASLPAAYGGSGFASATWGSGALSCNACHGRSTASGMPDYTSGTPGSASANSHPKHVTGSSIACSECHERTTKNNGSIRAIFPSAHVNKTAEVFFNLSGANKAGVYAAAVGSKSCSNTYCHGSAAIQWGGASLSCTSCHGASNAGDLSGGTGAGHALHVNSPTAFNNLTGSSQTSTSAYVFSCKSCHPTASHATGPASALSAAGIGGSALAAAQYTAGATSLSDSKGFKYTAGSCSTNSCHNNGRGGAPLVAASWSAAATGTCLSCHDGKQTGATASTLSARHDRHMNPTNNALIGLNNGLNCVDCHAKTVSGNTTVSNKARHVNGFLDYSGLRAGGSARYNAGTKQCSNIYCHSNGNPGALVYVNMTGSKAWSGTATLGCNGCHGRSGSLGAPDYLNGGAAPLATANSHAKHVAGAADTTVCATCHLKTANASLGGRFKDYTAASYHLNGTSNVYFSAAKAGTGASFTPASGTCNNVTCHGGTGSSVVWGGSPVNCQDCHGNGATASVADFGAGFWNNGTASKFQMTGTGSWADTGHGRPTASGNYPGSANAPANFAGVTNFCEWCHDSSIGHNVPGNPFRLRNWSDAVWGKNGVCMLCHATGSVGVSVGGQLRNSVSNKVGAYHYGAKHSTALSGGQYCWDCHDPHGAGSSNQFMIRQQVALSSDATTGAPVTQSGTAVVFTLSATPTGTDYAKSAAPFNGICNVCHTTTGHYTTAAGDAHNSGTRCTSCHSHDGDGINKNTAFTPVGGGVSTGGSACFGCHSNLQAAMSVTGSARTGSYHHVLGTSASDLGDLAPGAGSYSTSTGNLYCTSCHADHNYFNNGGTITTKGANLRSDIANASGAAPVNTDFLATGSNGICVSCHSASLARDSANQAAGGVATTPVIAGAVFAASMHNYTTMSSFGTQQFAANCVKCHSDEQAKDKQTSANKFGPHFSASVSLLDDLGSGTNAQYREQTMCFRCHSQTSDTALGGTLKAVNGKDWFGSSTMRSFAEDTFKSFTSAGRSPRHKISKYTGLHKANETLADLAANKHVECADCHSPHAAKFGNHSSTTATTAKGGRGNTLAGVLTGASGVTVTAWGAATPTTAWGLNATSYGQTATSTLPAATLEYQVCFKCHTKAMGATGWFKNMTSAGQMGGKNLTWTDLSVEFNPNNAARHPIGAALGVANQLTAARLSGGWTPGSVMTCSDCHSTDSTASKGPHGSAVKWMLAGTNKAWPYSTAAGNGATAGTLYRIATYNTGVGTKDGLFCLNCHTIRPASGVNNWHSNSNVTAGQHGSNATVMACVSCHIRVPHGGKISRLLQTTNAPPRYKSNANGATANFGGWGTSTVNIKGSSFSSANFKSSCGQHNSGASGGEAW